MELEVTNETSNDENATVSDEQINEWAGLGVEETSDEDQDENQSEQEEEPQAKTAEEIMQEEGEEVSGDESTNEKQPTGDFDLVKTLNDLKPIHNNIPFEIESSTHALELIQKGYDYTQKMQGFSQEKNAAYDEYNSKVEELENSYTEHEQLFNKAQIFDFALKNMEETNPSLYDEVMAHVNGSTQSFNNPVIASLQNKISTLESLVNKTSVEGESKNIVQGLERDLESFKQEITPAIKNIGLVPQWDKVKDVWARDKDGKLSVKQAFYAIHGEDIQKLRASKQTVAQVQRKTNAAKKPSSVATMRGSRAGGSAVKDYSKMSMEQAAMDIAFG